MKLRRKARESDKPNTLLSWLQFFVSVFFFLIISQHTSFSTYTTKCLDG